MAFLSRVPIIKGVLVAFLVQFLAVIVLASLFHFTGLSDQYLGTLVSFIVFLGVACGGVLAAKAAEAKYLFNGLGVGIVSLIIIIILSLINGVAFEMASIGIKALNYLGAGMVGGLLGALFGK